jgi:hypothetical protein
MKMGLSMLFMRQTTERALDGQRELTVGLLAQGRRVDDLGGAR